MAGILRDKGPACITFDSVVFPAIFNEVNLKVELKESPVTISGHGETPVDSVDMGYTVELETMFTQETLAQLAELFPGAVVAATAATITNRVGNPLATDAKELIIKPLIDNVPSTDDTEWITIFLAFPIPKAEIKYDNETQRGTLVSWKIFPNATGQLLKFGTAIV